MRLPGAADWASGLPPRALVAQCPPVLPCWRPGPAPSAQGPHRAAVAAGAQRARRAGHLAAAALPVRLWQQVRLRLGSEQEGKQRALGWAHGGQAWASSARLTHPWGKGAAGGIPPTPTPLPPPAHLRASFLKLLRAQLDPAKEFNGGRRGATQLLQDE